jgi:peptidoglycan/xylan/chitin deacetylase (PgdA/CDA1 family)
MTSLIHTIATKGAVRTVKRYFAMKKRYGSNQDKMKRNLESYIDLINSYEAKITFPTPGITMKRNCDTLLSLSQEGIEWSLHGHRHTDYSKQTLQLFEKDIIKGQKVWKDNDIELFGYRGPYLSPVKGQAELLAKLGFAYDSSVSYMPKNILRDVRTLKSVKRILDYYKPISEPSVKIRKGFAEIPVWLPDDEILVDRMELQESKIQDIWLDLAEQSMQMRAPLVLQLHPERIGICKRALASLLKWGADHGAKFVNLHELASCGILEEEKAVIAITGDLDIMSLSDLKAMKT